MQLFNLVKEKNYYTLSNNDKHHLIKVLRFKVGNTFTGIYENIKYECLIVDANNFAIDVLCEIKDTNKINNKINLFVGVIKKNNFEMLVSTCCQMNCMEITPVYFERSQKNNILNIERLNKISFECSKQSNKTFITKINNPIFFQEMISQINNDKYFNVVAYEKNKTTKLDKIKFNKNNINIIIGPEGGISEKEISELNKYSINIKLINSILKTENAATCLLFAILNKIGE